MNGYEEEGYTAFDSCDGDLTSKVIRTEDKDTLPDVLRDAVLENCTVTKM